MKRIDCTGQACVGDLRLSPLDVGFDVRLQGMAVELPDEFKSVGFEKDGKTWLVEGTREEMVEAIKVAGYKVSE